MKPDLRFYLPDELGADGYPLAWPEISFQIRETAGWTCARCRHPHDVESGHVLTVHHLDGDKANCCWWNLPALCQRCHLHVQGTVRMDQGWMFEHSEWFKPYAAAFYAWSKLGENLPPQSVLARLDELLALGRAA